MKKIHIILLLLIVGAIAVLITFLKTSSTYETVAEAKSTPNKFVHVAVKLDRSVPIEYDAIKNPDKLYFNAIDAEDSTQKIKVVYINGDRPDIKEAQRLVLKGKYKGDYFECVDIQTKCPSKYKDDLKAAEKNVQNAAPAESPSENSSPK